MASTYTNNLDLQYHSAQPHVRSLRINPGWKDEIQQDGVQLTEHGPGMSFYAVAALALFVGIVVVLTIVVCLVRLHVWRIHRWKRRHVVLPSDSEHSDSDDDDNNNDFDKNDPDGLFKTHKKRDAAADHEYIQRTMKSASEFVRQCLKNQTSFRKTAVRPSLINDYFDLPSASSCGSSSSHDDDGTTSTVVTTMVNNDDAECPTTISVSIQPATNHDLIAFPQPQQAIHQEAKPFYDVEASSTNY